MFGDRLYTTERQLVVRGPNPAHNIAHLRPRLFSKINIKIIFIFFRVPGAKKNLSLGQIQLVTPALH